MMFLDATSRRNPGLIETAFQLHDSGAIGPDTYLIDLDAIEANARQIAEVARAASVVPWFVIKQFGRNPAVIRAVSQHIRQAAAIDVRETPLLVGGGAELGNVGHLVQIPRRAWPRILSFRPQFVTVYDSANLDALCAVLRASNPSQPQNVLLKIAADPSEVYPGQEGGFSPADVTEVARRYNDTGLVTVRGVTSFPCILFNEHAGLPRPTRSFQRAREAAQLLETIMASPVLSAPSHSSCSTIPMLAALGATHVEPGHALTGTTPEHAIHHDLPEQPGMLYVSEVAQVTPTPRLIGGGFYARGHATNVLFDGGARGKLHALPPESIDYYRGVDVSHPIAIGDTAVMAFRTQIFVTRSTVAVVAGISSGNPALVGIWDSQGQALEAE